MTLLSNIESILFVASKPLAAKTIAKVLQKSEYDVIEALENLLLKYNRNDSGIHILHENNSYQMATNPENSEVIESFIKNDIVGELTKAQLETLTVISYRGPITRPEIEQIRGVNCAIIIRNLMMRGLVNESQGKTDLMASYSLSVEALSHLGIDNSSQLADYETLHAHEYIDHVLNDMTKTA